MRRLPNFNLIRTSVSRSHDILQSTCSVEIAGSFSASEKVAVIMSRLCRTLPSSLLAFALCSLTACTVTDDLHPDQPITAPEEDGGSNADTGAASGQVRNASGAGLAFAEVIAGEFRGFADATGAFTLDDLATEVTFLTFRKDDRTSVTYRPLDVTPGASVHFPEVVLLPLTLAGSVQSADGGDVALGDLGTGASFPPDAFLIGDQPFGGRGGAFMAVGLPSDDWFAAAFPGAMAGVRADGETEAFLPEGVVWTNVIGNGQPLGLAPDVSATLRLGLPAAQAAAAPETIVAWQVDPDTGAWIEIGESNLVEGVYSIDVPRLAPVCWSEPLASPCEVSGRVEDQNGNPVASANVLAGGEDGQFRSRALADENGVFTLAIAPGRATELVAYAGNIAGAADTLAADVSCPHALPAPLAVTLPDYSVTLTWEAAGVDLDTHYDLGDGAWRLDYTNLGDLDAAPFTALDGDDRSGDTGETVRGRRWYQGTSEYWVHDYEHRSSEALRGTGARVLVSIADSTWSFAVADVPFPLAIDGPDTTVADSSGWWHVFDIEVTGLDVRVVPIQAFASRPLGLRPRAK